MYKVKVYVTLREDILDPQGKAVEQSVRTLGYDEVSGVRIGKLIELDLDIADYNEAEKSVKDMCEKLLANTVIEDYKYELIEVA